MNFRHRLRRLEESIAGKDRFRGRREVYLYEPTNPEHKSFAFEQTFNVPHRQRRYKIQVVGAPPLGVYSKIGKELLPAPETLKNMTDAQLQTCQEKYLAATLAALNASRQKLGLPSVFTEEGTCQERTG